MEGSGLYPAQHSNRSGAPLPIVTDRVWCTTLITRQVANDTPSRQSLSRRPGDYFCPVLTADGKLGLLNDHHLKGGGLTLRLKVACLRLKPLESFPAESRLKARSAL